MKNKQNFKTSVNFYVLSAQYTLELPDAHLQLTAVRGTKKILLQSCLRLIRQQRHTLNPAEARSEIFCVLIGQNLKVYLSCRKVIY